METDSPTKTYTASLDTPLGEIELVAPLPDGFIPITAIVPLMRTLGNKAQEFETASLTNTGKTISCKNECAACCRMMIPLSPPEAFVLLQTIEGLSPDRRKRVEERMQAIHTTLRASRLWEPLQDLSHSSKQFTDEQLEPLNRAYYSLKMPCMFLENESCSIYDQRPAACRELLVTSPANLCDNMVLNPIETISIPLRISTTLSTLWATLVGGPTRLIPLPLALDWAKSHHQENQPTWSGKMLFEKALTIAAGLLRQYFQEHKTSQ